MKIKSTFTILAMISLSVTALADESFDIVSEKQAASDIVLLEDMSLFNEVSDSNFSYDSDENIKFNKQKNRNLYNLKEKLSNNPEFYGVIQPVISFLEESHNSKEANSKIPELLIKLSKNIDW